MLMWGLLLAHCCTLSADAKHVTRPSDAVAEAVLNSLSNRM